MRDHWEENVYRFIVFLFVFDLAAPVGAAECKGWWVFGRFEKDQVRVDQCTQENGLKGYYVENLTKDRATVYLEAFLKDGRRAEVCHVIGPRERIWRPCAPCDNIYKFEMRRFTVEGK